MDTHAAGHPPSVEAFIEKETIVFRILFTMMLSVKKYQINALALLCLLPLVAADPVRADYFLGDDSYPVNLNPRILVRMYPPPSLHRS